MENFKAIKNPIEEIDFIDNYYNLFVLSNGSLYYCNTSKGRVVELIWGISDFQIDKSE